MRIPKAIDRNGRFWWVIPLIAMIAAGWFLHWNEHDSPWGRDVQAAKTEMLRKQLCN